MRAKDGLPMKSTPRYITPAVILLKIVNSTWRTIRCEMPKKERVWTETELKFLALVLADEETEFAVRLETLASKKSANNEVFEEISKKFNELMSNEFKEENEREKSHKQTEIHSIGRFFVISSSILSKELNPSSAAFLLFDKSFTNCVLAQFAAILKFAAKDWSY